MAVEFRDIELHLPPAVLQEVLETLKPHLRPMTTEAERDAVAQDLCTVIALVRQETLIQVGERYRITARH